MKNKITIDDVLSFWFSEPMNRHWFSSTPAIDQQIRERFEVLWENASEGKLADWMSSASGCLALCIVLDQMPLNMFRNEMKSFSTEQQAVRVVKYAIKEGLDKEIDKNRVSFLYMPLMHSENLNDQDLSVEKFTGAQLENNLRFAKHHREIVRKYGRFPHRNTILGRESSQVEIEYLNSDKAFKG